MDTMYRCCAGLDIHKETVVVCIRRVESGGRIHTQIRTFGTMTRDLLGLLDWLKAEQVEAAAMESTGVFWKPVWNILEGSVPLLLANARHIKQVPGRKTDVKDCDWIAQLLQHGLLRASYVPERSQRELRDLTRQRSQWIAEQTRTANRIHKILEDANIKLGSVATNVLGVSGRIMIEALIQGATDANQLTDMARGRLRGKAPQLREALQGHVTDHHRFMLQQLLIHLDFLAGQMEQIDRRIEEQMRPFQAAIERVMTIPGIGQRTAQNILAEIGTDMSRFPSAAHLSSWAGVCPGNRQSAGKRRDSRTNLGNRWLRTTLIQATWASTRTQKTYLSAQYRRMAGRRGKKRAIIAVVHTILVMIYHMLSRGADYHELGHDYLDKLRPHHLTKSLVKRLESLGYTVVLTPNEQVA